MTSDWQKILDDFSGSSSNKSSSKSSTTTSDKKSTSTKTDSSTKTNTSTKKKKKWQTILDDFMGEKEEEKVEDTSDDSSVADRVEARAKGEQLTGEKKEEKEEQKKGWFQKGAFDDGYDFGDITKTILGTGADILEDLGAGIAEMPEKFADAMATIAPYYAQSQINQAAYSTMNTDLLEAADMYDLEAEKKKVDEFVKRDLYDGKEIAHGILNPVTDGVSAMIGQDYETASVLGEKGDSIVQSGGQLLATMGLQAVGVPWFLTTGVTAYGAEAENALNQGATHEEAMGSAAIAAATEILTEKISGGIKFGGKAADDWVTDRIARVITNKLGRSLTRVGVDAAGESFEELLAELVNNAGSALYRLDEESWAEIMASEEALDGYLDAIIGGGLMGVVSGGFKAVDSTRKGVDYVSGLTANEQKVVDKVYKDRLAEEQKKGKLTEKQKDEIYDRVLSDMDKGYITTDEIESALGGNSYDSYLNLKAEADEYKTLYETESGKLSEKQKDRLAELKEKNKAKSYEEALKEAQGQISENVFSLVKGDRLTESYNEQSRRGQAFEADLTKYDAKQQEVIKRAVDSGILNNTNRTRDFVDMVAKISADKGVLFDFTNNQKLKDSGFAVDGKQVNGYVTKDGITLNIDSAKAMNTTVGHEITHVLEGTEFYDSLKQTIFEYAKTKGEYQTRYDSLAELYKDVKDADIDKELTADLVGDYLFNDTDFIKNLSVNNRNVFQKIYDEIKYLCKVVTAGSKEARELERVKKAFADAYRADGKEQTDTKYSLNIKHTDGSVEVLADARSLTNEQTIGYLNQAKAGSLRGETYIPVRKDTPQVIIDTLAQVGENVENRSLVMQVRKAQQTMSASKGSRRSGKYGNNVRGHGLSAEQVVEILNKLDNPNTVIYQTNRQDANGNSLPNNVAVFVEYNNNGSESVAVIEFDSSINPESIGTEFGDTSYHTVVTVFEPDVERNGMDFDYAEELLSNPDNIELKIEKRQSTESATRTNQSNTSNELPSFDASIAQKGENVNYSLSDDQQSLSVDSVGRKLTPSVAKRFGNSKVLDENGSLKPVYHGTASGEFTIFDKTKGSVEGDFGSGFYFTDNEADVSEHYEGGGPDFDNKVGRRADEIWNEEPDIEYEEAEERARAELYKGSHKFEVYLNIENPAIVGETMLFDGESYREQYNEEDYDDYDDYTADVEQAIADDIENIVWAVEKNVDVYSVDGLADVLYEAYYDGGIGIEDLKSKINNLYLEDSNGNLVGNEVTRQIIESLGYDGIIDPTVSGKWNMDIEEGTTHYIVFKPNQIKSVTNENPTDNPDIHRSLSNKDEAPVRSSYRATLGKDIALQTEEVAPTISETETVDKNATTEDSSDVPVEDMREMFPDEGDTPQVELDRLNTEREALEDQLYEMVEAEQYGDDFNRLTQEWAEVQARAQILEAEIEESESGRINSLEDSDIPPEMDAPLSMKSDNYDPLRDTTIYDIDRSTRSYSDTNPGARHFLEEAALGFGYDVNNSTHGERWYNDQLYYESGGEKGFDGVSRNTTSDIAELKDAYGYTWDELLKAANDVAKGEFRSVAAKRVELLLHKRLLEGYTDIDGRPIPANQEYISFLNETLANQQAQTQFDSFMETADMYAPEDIAPTPAKPLTEATPDTMQAPIYDATLKKGTLPGQQAMFEESKNPTVARVLTEETDTKRPKRNMAMKAVTNFVDKGMAVENLSLKTGNMELQAKYDYAIPSKAEARAQYLMEHGDDGVKSLDDIIKAVEKTGKTEDFYNYLYHVHNIDRMNLESRFGVPNKAVFGETVTADVSKRKANQLEMANPKFKSFAEDIYTFNRHLRQLLVDGNVISQETSDLWEKMYPHYVPIRRKGDNGLNVSVPLDTNKTGVNNPVKRATGGSSDIEPLFGTMADRTIQVYKAIARNDFGIELKNTLGTTVSTQETSVDDVIDSIDMQDSLLKAGMNGKNPTFTVFENGERVEFEITADLYDALKPTSESLAHRNKVLTGISNIRRNLLTSWNPVFALYRNPVKDLQDMMINSQHPLKTAARLPQAVIELATNGKLASEYLKNGGDANTYYDADTKSFDNKDNILKKLTGIGLLENAGDFIEKVPRLAEYIASRKDGRSIQRSMLDASRVTTNFAAGGDVTKFANAHGFTFLNASVQGASQHVRNFREAKMNGLKGWVQLAAKYTLSGLPGILLNNLLWDDDEDYEELADYVKQNYYVIAKTEEGKFIRIPKGRTAAVVQNAMEQIGNLLTGDDEADFQTFFELFMNNIAPNNPLENNILSPIIQTASNKTWYGEDLIPSRLADLPAEEQFDESTDAISKWLGEKAGLSPYKINYLLDQYSGGLGDTFLPMLTPEAESGDNSFMGNMIAPWKKEMTTDSVLNNKNPGDFYELKDELDIVANGKNATDEDKMKSVYLDSVGWDMSDLYAQKREIQSSDLPDDQKYEQVREIQEQINELAKNALDKYNNVRINGAYSEAGDRRFNYDAEKDKWYEINEKNPDGTDNWYYIQEQLSHDKLGISYDDFWNDRRTPSEDANYYAEYNGKRYDYSEYNGRWYEIEGEYLEKEQNAIKRYGITPENYWNNTDLYYHADRYFDDIYATNDREVIARLVFGGERFAPYAAELSQIRGEDNNGDGKTDSGTKKANVKDYIFGLDLDYGEKIIMYRTLYSSKADKKAYNMEIVNYLNSRDDISYHQMKTILEELGMKVDSKGYINIK